MFKDIDDAIKHERKMAKEYKETADSGYAGGCSFAQAEGNVCLEFAKEHEQVIKWLEELKARREADRWIPVSERKPDKEGKCIVFTNYGDVTMDSFVDGIFVCNLGNVTHWKPLPKAPESEGE